MPAIARAACVNYSRYEPHRLGVGNHVALWTGMPQKCVGERQAVIWYFNARHGRFYAEPAICRASHRRHRLCSSQARRFWLGSPWPGYIESGKIARHAWHTASSTGHRKYSHRDHFWQMERSKAGLQLGFGERGWNTGSHVIGKPQLTHQTKPSSYESEILQPDSKSTSPEKGAFRRSRGCHEIDVLFARQSHVVTGTVM